MTQADFERFDMVRKPYRQSAVLRPLIWLLSFPSVWKHKVQVERIDMDELKPPYLLLCNHNSFLDFKVATTVIFPNRANYVVAIDGFIKREWLLRKVGCICKRKFTNDIVLVKQLRQVIKNGDIAVLYPEARYSLCGTAAVLPKSIGKLAKFLNVPVVTLIIHGDHITAPFWNTKDRKVKNIKATVQKLITVQELKALSVSEINDRIDKVFQYDDFAWQRENSIKVKNRQRAKGLHKVLYQCPHCLTEYRMMSGGIRLWCNHCKKEWKMTEFGELKAVTWGIKNNEGDKQKEKGKQNPPTEFAHIPDWYDWERMQVRREVENGSYYYKGKVNVKSLPNAKGYIGMGEGELTHDISGFTLTGRYLDQNYEEKWSAKALYSCHIEYNYLNKFGDCVDLNTLSDTYYIYPLGDEFSVTKMALATEELYDLANTEQKDII